MDSNESNGPSHPNSLREVGFDYKQQLPPIRKVFSSRFQGVVYLASIWGFPSFEGFQPTSDAPPGTEEYQRQLLQSRYLLAGDESSLESEASVGRLVMDLDCVPSLNTTTIEAAEEDSSMFSDDSDSQSSVDIPIFEDVDTELDLVSWVETSFSKRIDRSTF